METSKVTLEHIFASANRTHNSLDIGPNGRISFGCSTSVVLYEPIICKQRQRIQTLNRHNAKVISIKWAKKQNQINKTLKKTDVLLSGSNDGTVICWKNDSNDSLTFTKELKAHKAGVMCLDGLILQVGNNDVVIVVSAGADSNLKLWRSCNSFNDLECFQTFDFGFGFVLGLCIHVLPLSDVPIIACACDDFLVKLYTFQGSSASTQCENILNLKGHEDWVRGVNFTTVGNEVLLASCSQDSFIRLWKIYKTDSNKTEEKNESFDLRLKQHNFSSVASDGIITKYTVMIDAVLSGHENWVNTVQWSSLNGNLGTLSLVSASMDKTVVIWEYNDPQKVWLDEVRMGEVGGNTLGFYGAFFNHDATYIISHTFNGALHAWKRQLKQEWKPAITVSGHASTVNGIDWEPGYGRYLLSTSEDQTTRLFSEWQSSEKMKTWHEIARPQIHGYDLNCIHAISSVRFVSGADEKVLRVFDAPQNLLTNFSKLTLHNITDNISEAPMGASVPALGLSNKSVYSNDTVKDAKVEDKRSSDQYVENLFTPVELRQPPPETHLAQNSLWPECRKLYGHVYELFCVTSNHAGTLIASAAKSSQPKYSEIILWGVDTWEQVASLPGHVLTVTQMEFSPNDKYLLSVSRDRTWILHSIEITPDGLRTKIAAVSEKKQGHARIIWSCSWSFDNIYFATASRDKKVMVWELVEENKSACEVKVLRHSVNNCQEPVTAIAFTPKFSTLKDYTLAVGLESGKIKIVLLSEESNNAFVDLFTFDANMSHCLAVKQLKWRPRKDTNNPNDLFLASCGQDHQVKIFKFSLC